MIEITLAFLIGVVLGASYRELRRNIDDLTARFDEEETPAKKPGATKGSYKHIDEIHPPATSPKARGHVVTPKTPQKVHWDAEQELQKSTEKFRVGPK